MLAFLQRLSTVTKPATIHFLTAGSCDREVSGIKLERPLAISLMYALLCALWRHTAEHARKSNTFKSVGLYMAEHFFLFIFIYLFFCQY